VKEHLGAGAGNELSFALYCATSRMARMHKPVLELLGLTFSSIWCCSNCLPEARVHSARTI
jgi:hypothetical protein